MKIDAVVLAGAPNTGKLMEVDKTPYEALIPIHGRAIVEYVLDAVRSSANIGRIAVVGPEELRPYLTEDMELIPSSDGFSENILRGVQHFTDRERILLVTSDIPFLNAEALDDFLERCGDFRSQIYYPVVSKEANERRFPGVQRTYFSIKEGVFTGGNLLLVSPQAVIGCQPMVAKIVASRKKPWEMFRLLGPAFILRFLLKRLAIRDIEKRVAVLLGLVGTAIISPYPEIGTDVDKPSDWELACRELVTETSREGVPIDAAQSKNSSHN